MTLPEMTERSVFKTRGPLDPVNDGAIYVPRPELEQLLRAAQATSVDAYLAILSSRQTGKTTLLYQLRHRLRPRGVGVALIDLAVVRDQSEGNLYSYVAGGLRSELSPNVPRGADKKDAAVVPTNPIGFRRFMLDLARQVRAPRIVVLMDEVEAVPEKFSDAFFGTLRNIFSSRRKEDEVAFEKYLFILCGARELHRLTGGPNSPLNIAERIYLKDFDVAGVQSLVSNFQRAGIVAPPETAQWVYDQTGGHPYLTQKLCTLIEYARHATITPQVIQSAAEDILHSDDHLEKMILQVDTESSARDQLKQIAAGQAVTFSRLNPTIARLELLGAIRDAKQCVMRNALYATAFRRHFGIADAPAAPRKPWGRIHLLILAAILLAINLPFLAVYTSDILLSPRAVNLPVKLDALGASAIIRYDPILRANSTEPSQVSVEVEYTRSTAPIAVTFRKDAATDVLLQGAAQRDLKPPASQEKFSITLNQSGWGAIPYNPFSPRTEHRQAELVFAPQGQTDPTQAVPLDFRVDFYSGFVISVILSIFSAVTFVAGLLGNIQKVREMLDKLTKPNKA